MPRDNRCVYMAHVCFYVCCSDCVGVCGNVCCVAAIVKNSGFFCLGVLKYVVCLCRGCDGCCVFCLYCEAWSCRCSCMGSDVHGLRLREFFDVQTKEMRARHVRRMGTTLNTSIDFITRATESKLVSK